MKDEKNQWNKEIFFNNTLSKKLEKFIPLRDKEITIYLCGPTLYDSIHIGNSRPIIVFDALVSFLKVFFRKEERTIKYVRNITDIDEKILNKMNLSNKKYKDFMDEQIRDFNESLSYIQLNTAISCRVTENIQEIIRNIETIIHRGNAYVTQLGNVYFSVENFADYKILTGQNRKDLESVSVENEKDKKKWEDFALWKRMDNQEISWDSPWGRGLPGWHIECSTMATTYLSDRIDIHCGGQDLIFPHHDNEIAQCWGMNGNIFCHYWLHNGMVLVDGKKMSKSLNNFIQLKEIVRDKESGDILKYLMLSTHYHQPLNFSQSKWEDASNNVKKVKKFLKTHENLWECDSYDNFCKKSEIDFLLCDLCKDFNTVGCIFNIHKKIGEFIKIFKDSSKEENFSLLQNIYYEIIFLLNSIAMDYTPFKIERNIIVRESE